LVEFRLEYGVWMCYIVLGSGNSARISDTLLFCINGRSDLHKTSRRFLGRDMASLMSSKPSTPFKV